MNEIDKARLEVRETLKHLLHVIMDAMPGDLDKDDKRREAETVMDMIVDAEVVMVQNNVA